MSVALQPDRAPHASDLRTEAAALLRPLRALKRRLITRLLLCDLATLCIVSVGSGSLAMILDASFRWRSPLVRWTAAIFILTAFFSVFTALLLRRNWSFSLLGLADRIEELFPSSRGMLRSAVSLAMAPESDPLAGSHPLRIAALRRAQSSLSGVDLEKASFSRAARGQLLCLLALVMGLAIWSIAAPDTVRRAARRLAAPWRLDPWPRLVVLDLEAPAKIARGNDLLIVVRSKTAYLPSSATLLVSSDGDSVASQSMRREQDRLVSTLSNVTKSLWLRVNGGDDDQMRWRRIEVVEPVSLSMTRLEAKPPAYTKLPPFRVGAESILLEGTRLELEFKASRTIREAKPVLNDRGLPVFKIDSTGRRASGAFAIGAPSDSGVTKLRIDIRDQENALILGAYRGTIKVVRDVPPQIEWRLPRGNTKIQPASQLTLSAWVTDDVRLASLELRRRIAPMTGEPRDWQIHAAMEEMTGPLEYLFSQSVDAGPLALAPGDAIEWLLVVKDAKGQVKESEILRLSIVEIDELRKESDSRLERLLEQLVEAARRQREVAIDLQESVAPRAEGPSPASRQLAALRAAEFDEQALMESLSTKSGGLLDSWTKWLSEREAHQLQSAPEREQFDRATSQLTSIAQEQLPAMLREIDRRRTAVESSHSPDDLHPLITSSEQIRDALDKLVEELMHYQRWSRASQTVEQVLTAQQKLLDQTREAAPKLLGRLLEELSDEERSMLSELSQRQADLSEQLANLPSPPEPASEDWKSARIQAEEEMSQAARDLARNQLSQAESRQDRALEAIQRLASSGDHSSPPASATGQANSDSGAKPPQAGPTQAEVRELLARQSQLREKTKQTLEALKAPGADKRTLEAALAAHSQEQAELAKQVEAWQAQLEAAAQKEASSP